MILLIGFISGVISGAGFGGGTILILLLSMFLGIEQHIAQAANLCFFIPTAISASIINLKHKNIKLRLAGTISLFGMIGAFIGASISSKIEVVQLRKFFGVFLLVIACNEIYSWYHMNKKTENRHTSSNKK